ELTKQMMSKKPGERPTYTELIERLTGLLARVDPGSVPQLIAASRERSRPFAVPQGDAAPEGGATLGDGELTTVPRAGLPTWLVVFSLLCMALFVAGLVVYLQRDTSEQAVTPTPGSGSIGGGSAVTPTPDATPSPLQVPAGMIRVKLPEGGEIFV